MDKERAGIQSVEVGFSLVEALTRSRGPLMLKDLAAEANMSAAKAHRYLVSFQRIGLVAQDERTSRYDLGPAAIKLGLAALARLDPVRLARERMPALMELVSALNSRIMARLFELLLPRLGRQQQFGQCTARPSVLRKQRIQRGVLAGFVAAVQSGPEQTTPAQDAQGTAAAAMVSMGDDRAESLQRA